MFRFLFSFILYYSVISPNLSLSDYNYSTQELTSSQSFYTDSDDLTGNILDSASKPLKLAQANSRQRDCPVSLPEIESAIVYQSVEAPQIESMAQQEFQPNPNKPSFKSYDLVMGKPAGVLVGLDRKRMDRHQKFVIGLSITGIKAFRKTCFHEPFAGTLTDKDRYVCNFTRRDLRREGLNKFLPLPMNETFFNKKLDNLPITLTLFPEAYANNRNCLKKQTFYINIVRTPNLHLGFTNIIRGKNCAYSTSSFIFKVINFLNSKEVLRYIPAMFPINKVSSHLVSPINGNCDNAYVGRKISYTNGLLRDIDTLVIERRKKNIDRLIAITPGDYFAFHKQVDKFDKKPVLGFIIRPQWKEIKKYFLFYNWSWKDYVFLGGDWSVAFVRDDQIDIGTIAHELSHTFGQLKEQYRLDNGTVNQCQSFNSKSFVDCDKYKIFRGLNALVRNGTTELDFVENRWSILNNRGLSLKKLWIDRDTHQKIFSTLLGVGTVTSKNTRFPKIEKTYRVIISGFYNKQRDSFLAAKTRVLKTDIKTPSVPDFSKKTSEISVLTFKLIEILQEGIEPLSHIKRPALKMEITILHNDKTEETKAFELSHTMASFELPQDSQQRKYRIDVLNPQNKIIYTTPLRIKKLKDELVEYGFDFN